MPTIIESAGLTWPTCPMHGMVHPFVAHWECRTVMAALLFSREEGAR